jgi:hypothetical protein
MPDYRLFSKIKAARALTYASRTANASVDGDIIDRTSEGVGVLFVAFSGAILDGTHLLVVRVSDDGTTFADAAAGDVLGGGSFVAADDDNFEEISYKGPARYVRLRVTTSGSTNGGTFGAVVLTDGGRKPVLR